MSKIAPYLVVLSLAKSKQGRLSVSDPDLTAALVVNGKSTAYRLPTYVWEIRKKANLTVTPIRQGKSVIAYEFPALTGLASPESVASVEQAPADAGANVEVAAEVAAPVEIIEQFV